MKALIEQTSNIYYVIEFMCAKSTFIHIHPHSIKDLNRKQSDIVDVCPYETMFDFLLKHNF